MSVIKQICSALVEISFNLECMQIRRGLQELYVCKGRGREGLQLVEVANFAMGFL